ncbi:MAG TPA: hypothetical protein VGO21_03890 [Candidatus Paceibacterota bacterium]|nr:hypothetical protein [Candidatus Paceibacterota bacterium]
MFVISKLTQDVRNHQNTGGQAYGQSKNIYERKNLIPPKVPVSDLKIIFEHGDGLFGVEYEVRTSAIQRAILPTTMGLMECQNVKPLLFNQLININ